MEGKAARKKRFGLSPLTWKLIGFAVFLIAVLPFPTLNGGSSHEAPKSEAVDPAIATEVAAFFRVSAPRSWHFKKVESKGRQVLARLVVPEAFASSMLQRSADAQLATIAAMCPSNLEPATAAVKRVGKSLRIELETPSGVEFLGFTCEP